MLNLALTLLLLAGQPDDGPVKTNQVVPPVPAVAFKDAEEEDWGIGAYRAANAPLRPITEAEAREAANRAAIERAEQAGKDANTPPGAWPDDGRMRCKTTDSGFVCGNSDKALEPDSPSRKALDELLELD